MREQHLHRLVLARLGPAADRLIDLLDPAARRWPPPELRAAPATIDPDELGSELDRVGALRTLRLPLSFLSEVDESAGLPRLHRLLCEVELLERLRALHLPADVFAEVPAATVDCWRHRAQSGLPTGTARLPLLTALCLHRERELVRGLLLTLQGLIGRLHARASARLQPAAADVQPPRENAFARRVDPTARCGREQFPALVARPPRVLRAPGVDVQRARAARTALRSTYSPDYRQITAALLRALEFRGGRRCWPLLAALGELAGEPTRVWGEDRFFPPGQEVPVHGVVPEPWPAAVVDSRGRVDRVAYQLGTLFGLREALASGEITAPAADQPDSAVPDQIIWPPERSANTAIASPPA